MSFARTGEAAAKNYLLTTEAVGKNSWDPNKLIEESIKGRSAEKQMAAAADSAKFVSKQNSRMVEAKTQLAVDKFNVEQDLKKSTRKAGMIAAAGQLIGQGVMKTPDPKKPYQSNIDSIYKEAAEKGQANLALIDQRRSELLLDHTKSTELRNTVPGATADPTSATSGTLTPGIAVPTDISAQQSASSGSIMSKQQIKDLAVSQGFSPQDAAVVVGIAGGESGYDPTNSTRRLKGGLYDTTGEDSVGLMQINWGYHKDKGWLQDLGITSREQLFDPATNMKAAKYLHSGRGGFGDWTVYNKGIYKDKM